MSSRREARVTQNGRVWVSGRDANGNQFRQTARVMDVSWLGCRLSEIRCLRGPGEVVEVRSGGRKAEFSVVWVDEASGQAGIRAMKFGQPIWGVRLQPPRISAPPPEEKSVQMFERATPRRSAGAERRFPRHRCEGGAEVRVANGVSQAPQRVWATLDDLSMGGCHLKTMAPFPKDTRVDLKLGLEGSEIRAKGVVCSSRPGIGMGIAFLDLDDVGKQQLAYVAERLSHHSGPFASPLGGQHG